MIDMYLFSGLIIWILLQVADRHIWRSALESGRYELLSEENKENGIIKAVNESVEEMEIDEQAKVIVKDRYKRFFWNLLWEP